MFIGLAGLPGTGKTTIAAELAKQGYRVLARDEFLALLFKPANFSSREQKDTAYKVMLMVALHYLKKGERVVLDCPSFSQEWAVKAAAFTANKAKVHFKLIVCDCPEPIAVERIKSNVNHIATDRTPGLYKEVKARFMPIQVEHRVITTNRPIEQTMVDVNEYLAQ